MSRADKLMLWGAVAIMVAVGSVSFSRVSQAPAIDPEIASLKQDYEKIWSRPAAPAPRVQVPNPGCKFGDVIRPPEQAQEWAAFIQTKYVGTGVPRPVVNVYILSLPTPKTAVSTLDAATITWSLIEPKVELRDWMKRNEIKPTGYLIKRQCEDGQIDDLAEVDAKTFSYIDLTLKPRLTYRYWVVAKGMESDLDPQKYPHPKKAVTKGLETSVTTRTPSDTRAKLVGGDKGNAFIRIDTYDRASKKWIGKTTMAAPGQKIGPSGWVLKGLRFDNFTLVADVTDDEGVDRVLTTKD